MTPQWIAYFPEIREVLHFDTEQEARACVADTRIAYEELQVGRDAANFPTFSAYVYSEAKWRAMMIAGTFV